uniref:Cytochrome P450 n=1 Tax=Ditylenchus dipsaci TaxID=166011 RepID=A0A915D588_9BILA
MYLLSGTGVLETLFNSFLRRMTEIDMSKKSDIKVACFIFVPTYFVWNYFYRLRQFPPGPWPLPVIGNFLQIDTTNPHRSMIAWRKKYGPIFTIWMPKPVIVFASYEELHDRLENYQEGNYYIDRPLSFLYGIFSNHQPDGDGIILSKDDLIKRLADSKHDVVDVHKPLAFVSATLFMIL